MASNALPFPIGSKATAVDAGLVGRLFKTSDGRTVRLCKTATALTSPAAKASVFTITSGAPSYAKIKLSAAANDLDFAGIVDPDLSGNLAADDYFWVYCGKGDVVKAVSSGAVAVDLFVGTTTTTAGTLVSIGALATAITGTKLGGAIGVSVQASTTTDTSLLRIRLLGPA